MEDVQYKVAQRIISLYVDYWKDFAVMDQKGNTYRPRPQRDLTIADILTHLDGGNAVSVLANARSTIFLCFDVDVKDPDRVNAIRHALIDMGIPDDYIYISTSGGKGYHIELFFDGEVWNTRAQELYKLVFDLYGVNQTKVECRPLATMAIKLPLGINHKTGNKCWYVNKDTLEPIEDDEYIFSIKKFSVESLEEIIHAANKRRFYQSLETAVKPTHVRDELIYTLPVITAQGQRHSMMCSVAMHYRLNGADEDEIYNKLLEWADQQNRSLIESTDEEIEKDAAAIARSISKKNVTIKEQKPKRDKLPDAGTYITAEDAERILKITSKSYRKVAFLLFAYCRRFDPAVISYDQMMEITGLTRSYVIRATTEITEGLHYIRKKEIGGIKTRHGNRCRMANEYQLAVEDDGDRRYLTTICDVCDRFSDTYYGALVSLCDEQRLKEVLTRTEYKEINNEIQG